MAATNSPKFAKRVRRVLGLSADGWNNLIVGFGALAGIFALLAATSAYILFQIQKFEAIESAREIAEANARAEEAKLKSAQLEKDMNPRVIHDEWAKEFVDRVHPFPGTSFAVSADPAAERKFVNRVITLLQEGGWRWCSFSESLTTLPTGNASIPGLEHPAIAGVQVRVSRSRYDDLIGPANALSIALTEALNASTSVGLLESGLPPACSPDTLLIEIYRKL